MLTHPARPSRSAIRTTQILLVGPLGLLVASGALLFSLTAPTQPLAAADWLVAAIGLALGLTSIVVGMRLEAFGFLALASLALVILTGRPPRRRVAT